jgi:hypothetical protein
MGYQAPVPKFTDVFDEKMAKRLEREMRPFTAAGYLGLLITNYGKSKIFHEILRPAAIVVAGEVTKTSTGKDVIGTGMAFLRGSSLGLTALERTGSGLAIQAELLGQGIDMDTPSWTPAADSEYAKILSLKGEEGLAMATAYHPLLETFTDKMTAEGLLDPINRDEFTRGFGWLALCGDEVLRHKYFESVADSFAGPDVDEAFASELMGNKAS